METNTSGLTIQKPATSTDGYDGGLKVIRDATNAVGGTHGMVNCVSYTHTIAGQYGKQFEWNNLMILDNYADAGENCAAYIQSNKYGKGATWGLCVEACDLQFDSKSGLVTLELDTWVTGPDNGQRYCLDLVLGDSRNKRGNESSNAVGGTAALRVGTSSNASYAKWTYGIQFTGQVGTGIDFTGSSLKHAIKLGAGQYISINGLNIMYLLYGSLLASLASLAYSLKGLI